VGAVYKFLVRFHTKFSKFLGYLAEVIEMNHVTPPFESLT
jgi:hypothetical protein